MRQFGLIRELSQKHKFTIVCPASQQDGLYIKNLSPYVRRLEVVGFTPPPFPRIRSRLYWQFNSLRHTLFDSKPLRSQLPWSRCVRNAIDQVLLEERFDVIQVHQSHLGQLLPDTEAATVLDMHDILSDHEYRRISTHTKFTYRVQAWLEWKKMQSLERRIARRFDVCVTVSEHDKKSLFKLVPEVRAVVVPNGVDTNYFSPQTNAEQKKQVVFIGSMNYGPNSDGVLWFYNAVFPLIKQEIRDIQFWVVGSNPSPDIMKLDGDPNVKVTGFVEDVRPYIARASVIVVPIRLGSGTRLKILDAWSMEKAIVSTTVGAEGLAAVHRENILLADEPDQFAEGILGLLSDSELRYALGKTGRRLVKSRYAWSTIAPKMDAVYRSLRLHRSG